MQVDIHSGPAFAFGEIQLPPGGTVRVEAGAMGMTRGDVHITTSTQGGFLKGLRRSLGGESFFVNDFQSGSGGLVGVAAPLPGDMTMLGVEADVPVMVQSGSWLASDVTVDVDSKWGGGRSFFSGEGLILLRCSGSGDILRFSHLDPRSSEVKTSAAAAIAPMRCGHRVTRSRARQRPSRAFPRSVGARSAVMSWL